MFRFNKVLYSTFGVLLVIGMGALLLLMGVGIISMDWPKQAIYRYIGGEYPYGVVYDDIDRAGTVFLGLLLLATGFASVLFEWFKAPSKA